MVESQNPKDLAAKQRVPMGNLPSGGVYHSCKAIQFGADKYGPLNWRNPENAIGVRTYINACLRHIYAWMDGEQNAPDSEIHHLGHAVAGLLILMDAEACGTMIDDRGNPGALPRLLNPIADAPNSCETDTLTIPPMPAEACTDVECPVPDWFPQML